MTTALWMGGYLLGLYLLGRFGGPVAIKLFRGMRRSHRGFEVKTNTGETPVLLKKEENDHG